MAAYCGRTATLSLTGGTSVTLAVFNVNLTLGGNEIDVSAFGSGEFGDTIVCNKSGDLSIDSYEYLGDVSSITGYSLAAANKTFSGNCVGKDFTTGVDAKGVVTFNYVLKLTGNISIT